MDHLFSVQDGHFTPQETILISCHKLMQLLYMILLMWIPNLQPHERKKNDSI
jgi:hypothetical protein